MDHQIQQHVIAHFNETLLGVCQCPRDVKQPSIQAAQKSTKKDNKKWPSVVQVEVVRVIVVQGGALPAVVGVALVGYNT